MESTEAYIFISLRCSHYYSYHWKHQKVLSKEKKSLRSGIIWRQQDPSTRHAFCRQHPSVPHFFLLFKRTYALKELPWSTIHPPSNTLAMGLWETTLLCTVSPVQNICQDIYIWLFLRVKSLLSQGPVKQLCYEVLVKLQTGKTSGEAGGITSTGGKSWQHSLQRIADVTTLTQSLPKSLFVWVPSIASLHVHNCSRTQS